jgi:hypothetical protein
MLIERTNKEVIIRLPASVNTEGLQKLIDYLTQQIDVDDIDFVALTKSMKATL